MNIKCVTIIFVLALAFQAKASTESDLIFRIQAYTHAQIAELKNETQITVPVCSSENLIHQLDQQLNAMEIAMNKWKEIEDSHLTVKIENFKVSLIDACCGKKMDRSNNSKNLIQQQEGQHRGGGGRGRHRQQQDK